MYPPSPPTYGAPPPRKGIGVGWWLAIGLGGLLCMSVVGLFLLGFLYVRERRAAALARYEELAAHQGKGAPSPSEEDHGALPGLPSVSRHVPKHPLSILSGCADAEVSLVEDAIGGAIEIGAPAYNAGDFAGCYETYRSTAVRIENKLSKSCAGPARALAEGRATAAGLPRASDRAWAMRDAFDGLLEVIDRSRHSGSTL
jgi:hypothetical protein